MTDWLKIFIPMFIAASYDYDVHFGIAKESTKLWWYKLFRVLKFIADYPVTILILYACKWGVDLTSSYYFAKLNGWCDAIYIGKWKLYNPGKVYFEPGKNVDWLWWTFPVGIILTVIATFKNRKFTKGIITGPVYQWQLALGLLSSYWLYHFKAFTWFIGLFNSLVHKLILLMY